MIYHPRIGFHYRKLLTCLSNNYDSFSNIPGMDLGGSGYRQILICLCVINILAMKIMFFFGFMIVSGLLPLSLRSHNGLDIIMG